MKVEYVDHLGNDLTVVNSARVSFHKIAEEFTEKDKKLLSYLAKHNHWTPFSHPQITLREKVPIFVARQRFKHMIGFSYNEVSRRYVDEAPEFFIPSEWRARPEGSMKQGSGDTHKLSDSVAASYASLINRVEELYNEMILIGVAPEQARMILPQSMYTEYVVTGSLAAFARAYKLRIDSHAQKEIQYLAVEWDKIIRPLYPESWSALVDE
ncbi:MAG: FAD-dependent thymidylate synthase [Rhodovulum sulfidophilum]|uniref:FAD-dependent thymidylate synthase n=1 Tax=Rhodovulum sulfidophilum TaxID=35806 RepID=A0A2W5N063_RHOSU|nr:MAG: FAD-dependent thymidylate synthase [Rhodovulum sulfidophilum]